MRGKVSKAAYTRMDDLVRLRKAHALGEGRQPSIVFRWSTDQQQPHSAHAAAHAAQRCSSTTHRRAAGHSAQHDEVGCAAAEHQAKPLAGAAIRTPGKHPQSDSCSFTPHPFLFLFAQQRAFQHPLLSRSLLRVSDLVPDEALDDASLPSLKPRRLACSRWCVSSPAYVPRPLVSAVSVVWGVVVLLVFSNCLCSILRRVSRPRDTRDEATPAPIASNTQEEGGARDDTHEGGGPTAREEREHERGEGGRLPGLHAHSSPGRLGCAIVRADCRFRTPVLVCWVARVVRSPLTLTRRWSLLLSGVAPPPLHRHAGKCRAALADVDDDRSLAACSRSFPPCRTIIHRPTTRWARTATTFLPASAAAARALSTR